LAIINGAQPNVGNLSNADTTDDGKNRFLRNGIGNNKYELYNNNSLPIFAENNWWNTNHPDSIEARIVHQVDNPAFGLVDFNPFIQNDPTEIRETKEFTINEFELYNAYPNPFNPETHLSFRLGNDSGVSIEIFNVLGEHINTILNRNLSNGYHKYTWDGTNSQGQNVTSGIYIYSIRVGKQSFSNKIILMR